jgi:RND family efflux transporter MFP subunit
MILGRVVLPALGLALALGLAWNFIKGFSAQVDDRMSAERPRPGDQSPKRIIAEGRVVAYPGGEVTVSTEVLGTIINMPARENVSVRKGDLLVELRSDDVKVSLREAHLRQIEAEAGLRFLRARFQLDQVFSSPAAKAARGGDHRVEEEAAAVARRDASKATVERLEAEALKYRIVAPISGVVTARHVNSGETVTPGSPLVTIVDLSRLRVEAEVDEFDIPNIADGAKAIITAEGYSDRRWPGQVEEIPATVVSRQTRPDDPGKPADTRVLRVKVAFREANPLKLGQSVEIEIDTPGKNTAVQLEHRVLKQSVGGSRHLP